MQVKDRDILVVGLGRSGLPAANFLISRGARVTVTDQKAEQELAGRLEGLSPSARLRLGGHDEEDFSAADLIVLSPGVPVSLEPLRRAIERGVPVISEVELSYQFLSGPFIGITGSNGKTTTTTLIGELFHAAGRPVRVGGNIGRSLSEFIGEESEEGRVFVVELSSFQLETIRDFRCRVGLLLNVTPDHQDRYASFHDYARAKERIFLNQSSDDFALLNADDPLTSAMAARRTSQVFFFSRRRQLDEGIFVDNGQIRIRWKGQEYCLMPAAEVRLRGGHNLENVLAAAAAGFLFDLPLPAMAQAIREFNGVEHRLELVRVLDGVEYYNDSKATNIDSAIKAIESFEQPLVIILGGRDKGADFAVLKPLVRRRARLLIFIGEAAGRIEQALGEEAPGVGAGNLEEAVRLARIHAGPGDVVLLAPACTSFDMFEDYQHRGRVFKQAVQELSP